ncbi:hypothetical protein DIPPA_09777 [Diplonema papillatum]|nr:hypothetical protein DIPPA_09777 [Diplonema papillatum]
MINVGWIVLYAFLVMEIFVVTLLLLPLPERLHRGTAGLLRKLWHDFAVVRNVSFLILAVNMVYFYISIDYLRTLQVGSEMEIRINVCRQQRTSYITGFGLFLFFVMYRLMSLETEPYRASIVVASTAEPNKAKTT